MNEYSKKYTFLSISIIFIVAYNIIYFQGYFGYDDMEYAQLAKQVINGDFEISSNTFSARWVIIYLLALSYKLFGINEFSSSLPSLLMTISSVLILFSWLKHKQLNYIILAITFFITDYYTLFFSGKIYPDSFVTCASFGIAYLLLKKPFEQKSFFEPKIIFLLGYIWLGLLSKLTIFFVFIPMAWYVVVDIFKYKNWSFWLSFILLFCLTIFFYLSIYQYFTGNYFYRFDRIFANQYTTSCSYHELPIKQLLIRLTYGPIFMFIGSGMIMTLMTSFFRKNYLMIFFSIYFFTYYFMSTSYQHYLPMCTVEARHFLPLIPLSSILIADYLENSKHYYYLIITNFLMILICIFFVSSKIIVLLIIFEIILIIKQSNITFYRKYFTHFIVLLLLIHPLYSKWTHRNVNYTKIDKLIDQNYQGQKILIK